MIETLESVDNKELKSFYRYNSIGQIGLKAVDQYDGNVFPLTELSFVFARRLSIVDMSAIEIAEIFERVKSEADALLTISASMRKVSESIDQINRTR